MNVQKRIRDLMEQRGWSEYRLSKEAGLHESTIRNIFLRNGTPTVSTIESICRALNITLPEFFAESGTAIVLTSEEEALLSKWATLTGEQKKRLLDLIDVI